MLRKRLIVCLATLACACACMLSLVACGSSDANDFVGEWKIKDTNVTVVFTGSEFKNVGITFDYTIDPSKKTITYSSDGATGTSTYSFSDNKQTLTLEEGDGAKTTVFEKVSSNGNAEPSANGVTEDE